MPMSDALAPDAIAFNGVNGRTGRYLLTLTPAELEAIILKNGLDYDPDHLEELRERDRLSQYPEYDLEYGRDKNNLAQAGWGAVFPYREDQQSILALRDSLSELLDWRKAEAGDLYQEFLGPRAVRPNETANKFMARHGASPGTVDPTRLPYFLLLVGDVDEIPYRFQYELDATYLVGRVAFDNLDEYRRYAHSVVAAEKEKLRLARRAVFFGTNHPGDRATPLSATQLVAPLATALQARVPDWGVEHLAPDACDKPRLETLLGKGDAPALLFTAGHGIGYDPAVPAELALQPQFQGALLCQGRPWSQPPTRDEILAAEDIAADFSLHGLIAFHFACYGLGTPRYDSFTRPEEAGPVQLAPRSFLAALPRRLLSHPRGGALAVVGHVDRAVSYSFVWDRAGEQTTTFRDTLHRLMAGERVGVALDQFNLRYAQIAALLTNMLQDRESVKPNPQELKGLWTATSDARGYALLGDPAVRLPVAAPPD
jgi:hypothetical protein